MCLLSGDIKLTQSMTILRHLARENDLIGKTPDEQRKVDLILDVTGDFRQQIIGPFYTSDYVRKIRKKIF